MPPPRDPLRDLLRLVTRLPSEASVWLALARTVVCVLPPAGALTRVGEDSLTGCGRRRCFGFEKHLDPLARVERRLLNLIEEAGAFPGEEDHLLHDLSVSADLVLNSELILPDGDAFHGLVAIRLGFEAARAIGNNVGRIKAIAFVVHGGVDSPDVGDGLDLSSVGRIDFLNNIHFPELERPCQVATEVGQIRFEGGLTQLNQFVAPQLDPIGRKI